MGVMERLRNLDRRAEAFQEGRQLRERTALRLGVCLFALAVAIMAINLFTEDNSFGGLILVLALNAGINVGRVQEARAVRKGRGQLRPDPPA